MGDARRMFMFFALIGAVFGHKMRYFQAGHGSTLRKHTT
jgi:hypothetical protein